MNPLSLSLSLPAVRTGVPPASSFTRALFFVLALRCLIAGAASTDPFSKQEPPPLVGRWDLKVRDGSAEYPSWLEIRLSGYRTLVGSYVGQFGSVRPVAEVRLDRSTGSFEFTVPPQWERRTDNVVVKGRLDGDVLRGETTNEKGGTIQWEGRRAPSLDRAKAPHWGKTIRLFNGRDLSGFKVRHSNLPNGWKVIGGRLTNAVPGNDLVTEQSFRDFKLKAVFRYPPGSNSGIYLRGRYEVQIEDNYGREPDSHYIGGVYGHLTPRVNAARQAMEWQTLEITLVGRVVTVKLNGEPVIERQAIPGITGGALDSNEGEPGPILIQGDHGPVEFKELTVVPGE